MKFKPLYYKDKLEIINPEGSAGIVTLWNKPEKIYEKIKSAYPQIFSKESPLVTLTSLYGNGLPQMLANLIYNPQINKIAIVGNDTPTVPSGTYFLNFLEKGVKEKKIGGVLLNEIIGTTYAMDPQLLPKYLSYIETKKFTQSKLEGLVEFLNGKGRESSDEDRIKIDLAEPKFSDFPSDLTSHNIIAQTPLDAWMDVMYHLDRYGKNVILEKGLRRALFNLDVNIKNPSFESEEKLLKFGFNPEELRLYQKDLLRFDVPKDISYTYGNRMRSYWGADGLEKISKMLDSYKENRHGFLSLWDTKNDLLERNSSPCLTDLYFVKNPQDNTLMLSAGFRTHNAVSAWLTNLYGLRAVQEKVSKDSGITPGQINIRSRWIGIDPENSKTISALGLVNENRKINLDVSDPKGYYGVTVDMNKRELVVEHYNPDGLKLEEFRGKNSEDLKNQIRQIDGFSTTDHAMWVGVELARKEQQLKN